jgi:hypothetical protein
LSEENENSETWRVPCGQRELVPMSEYTTIRSEERKKKTNKNSISKSNSYTNVVK